MVILNIIYYVLLSCYDHNYHSILQITKFFLDFSLSDMAVFLLEVIRVVRVIFGEKTVRIEFSIFCWI